MGLFLDDGDIFFVPFDARDWKSGERFQYRYFVRAKGKIIVVDNLQYNNIMKILQSLMINVSIIIFFYSPSSPLIFARKTINRNFLFNGLAFNESHEDVTSEWLHFLNAFTNDFLRLCAWKKECPPFLSTRLDFFVSIIGTPGYCDLFGANGQWIIY